MKKIFTSLAFFFDATIFAQINIPKTSEKGILVLKNNIQVSYRDLKYDNGKVTYTNSVTNEFVYDASIIEVKGNATQLSQILMNTTVQPVKATKLTNNSDITKYLAQNNDQLYMKGKSLNNTGTAFIVGGANSFAVGGILNLTSASNKVPNSNGEISSTRTPIPLIVGLAGIGGVLMKISGYNRMKKAVANYNSTAFKRFSPQYFLVNNRNVVGMRIEF